MKSKFKPMGIKKKIDLVENKPNKVRTVVEKKQPLKSELIVQLNALQGKYDVLQNEHENSLQTIKTLQEKVSVLQKRKQESPIIGKSQESQTFSNDIQISCNQCIYLATCEEELNWHMGYEHDLSDELFFDKDFFCEVCDRFCKTESELIEHKQVHIPSKVKVSVDCNFCEKHFLTQSDLMSHKKIEHAVKVATCWNFSSGKCDFQDEECWFIHRLNGKHDIKQLTCSFCDKIFSVLPELLKHRKKEHKDLIAPCRNILKGACKYGTSKCWFNHDDIENPNESEVNVNKENNNVIQKLFEMMETMTERIVQMEESNLEKS